MLYYKIIDFKNNKPHTLFHGINGSREMPISNWIKADKKNVIDGSGGTVYLSGFHVLKTKKECLNYFDNFTNKHNRRIAVCEAKGLRKKEHSRHDVLLADEIKIIQIL